MTALNRFVVIDKVYEIFVAALVGSGKVLQEMFDHAPASLNSKTPVCVMGDGGIGRTYQGMGTQTFDNEIFIELAIFVAEAVADDSITTDDVARKRAEIEAAIADVVRQNQRVVGYWENLTFNGERSTIIDIEDADGNPYKGEIIVLVAEAPDV